MKTFNTLLIIITFYNTVLSQLSPNRHNTSYTDAWVSCSESTNPNDIRGNSHWLMMDLNFIYTLGELRIWNYNDPEHSDYGFQELVIDVSEDGIHWTEIDTIVLEQAQGSSFYEGQTYSSLNEIEARYLLFTGISNFNGNCYGLSELKINIGNSSLPIELVSFSADCKDEKILLNWVTTNEVNSSHYDIYGSSDGKIWTKVSNINSNNGKNINEYQFLVDEFNFEYFYIENHDIDGSSQKSKIISKNCNSDINISVQPNPFTDQVVLILDKSNNVESLDWKMYNTTGHKIAEGTVSTINNQTTFPINMNTYPSGEYFLDVNSLESTKTFKLTKL
ncbi:MAG TPA: discoidin domain-containing protein [Saprospiraceae bacterium]|nr:discoidin domain-containing protein [Saprospiraceae bacterium]